jgi:hypothetical protein
MKWLRSHPLVRRFSIRSWQGAIIVAAAVLAAAFVDRVPGMPAAGAHGVRVALLIVVLLALILTYGGTDRRI